MSYAFKHKTGAGNLHEPGAWRKMNYGSPVFFLESIQEEAGWKGKSLSYEDDEIDIDHSSGMTDSSSCRDFPT